MFATAIAATALLATGLPRAAADASVMASFNVDTCAHEQVTAGDGACMWTGDAGGSQPSCDHCDDKCVVRANSSDIAVGAQTKIVQDSLCVTLATLVNLFAGSDDEEANVEDFAAAACVQPCPSKDDVKKAYPAVKASADSEASGGGAEAFARFQVLVESEGALSSFFEEECENGKITVDGDGVSGSIETCVNKGGATSVALQNSLAMDTACKLSAALADDPHKCLTPGAAVHVSADCLAAVAATVEADAGLTAAMAASYQAVHDECAKLTTQEECTGAALVAEEAARKEAEDKAVESAKAMPSGALAARAAAAAVAGLVLLAVALM